MMAYKFWIKLAFNGIIVVPLLLWFTEATAIGAAAAAFALAVIAFFAGDQMILRVSNNLVATVADAVLAALFLWVVAFFSNWTLSFTELIVIVALLGLVEIVYHRMLGRMDKEAA